MIDIKIAVIRDVLPHIKAERVLDDPPTVEIIGDNFLEATAVYMNDVKAPEMIIFSNDRLWAQIPESQKNEVIRSLSVVSETISPRRQSLLHFELNGFRTVSGIQRLVQYFAKLLIQSPGTDIFNKDVGGGFLKMIGQNDIQNGRTVKSEIIDAINRTKNYIISNQTKNPRIPMTEKLLNVEINNVGFDVTRTEVTVNLTLTNMTGEATTTNLRL